MVSLLRLWCLVTGYGLTVGGAHVNAQDQCEGMKLLANAVTHHVGKTSPQNQQILIVGPAKKSAQNTSSVNECLVLGDDCMIVDACAVLDQVEIQAWVSIRLRQSPGNRYLLLLANTGYIGQYSLPFACYNGQTPIAPAILADLQPLLEDFPRWEPPITPRSALVDWHDAVGQGSTYSVWFHEHEEGDCSGVQDSGTGALKSL